MKGCSALESGLIGLEQEMFYRVKTTNPLQPTAGLPRAVIQYWQVSEAEPVGKRLRAKLAAESDQPTAWDEQYMRLSVTFDTGDARYSWLNKSLFVAAGRLLGTGRIEYAVYRVT
jgi:hypothetical protein